MLGVYYQLCGNYERMQVPGMINAFPPFKHDHVQGFPDQPHWTKWRESTGHKGWRCLLHTPEIYMIPPHCTHVLDNLNPKPMYLIQHVGDSRRRECIII